MLICSPNCEFRWGFLVIFWNFAGVPFVSISLTPELIQFTYTSVDSPISTLLFTCPPMTHPSINSRPPSMSFSSALSWPPTTCVFFSFTQTFWLCLTLSKPIVGTPPCRKRVVSRCRPKVSLNTARPSLNFPTVLSRTPSSFKPLTEIGCWLTVGGHGHANPYVFPKLPPTAHYA